MNISRLLCVACFSLFTITAMALDKEKHTPDSVAREYGFKDANDFKKAYDNQKPLQKHTPDSVAREYGFKDANDFKKWYDNQ